MGDENFDILPPVNRKSLVLRRAQPQEFDQEFGKDIARGIDEYLDRPRRLRGSNLPSPQGVSGLGVSVGLGHEPLQRRAMKSLQRIFGSNLLPALGEKLASMDEAENAFWAGQALSSDPVPLQFTCGGTTLLVQVAGLVLVGKDNSQRIYYGKSINHVARVLPVTVTGASLIALIMERLPLSPSERISVDVATFILAIGGVLLKG